MQEELQETKCGLVFYPSIRIDGLLFLWLNGGNVQDFFIIGADRRDLTKWLLNLKLNITASIGTYHSLHHLQVTCWHQRRGEVY